MVHLEDAAGNVSVELSWGAVEVYGLGLGTGWSYGFLLGVVEAGHFFILGHFVGVVV